GVVSIRLLAELAGYSTTLMRGWRGLDTASAELAGYSTTDNGSSRWSSSDRGTRERIETRGRDVVALHAGNADRGFRLCLVNASSTDLM
ncbi:hypothetical protein D9V41_06485, partial [Aeromicrobium phragmitis]